MDTFHFFVENPNVLEPDTIAEHTPVSVLYASVDPIVKIRFLSGQMQENDVAFVERPDLAKLQSGYQFRHHISSPLTCAPRFRSPTPKMSQITATNTASPMR